MNYKQIIGLALMFPGSFFVMVLLVDAFANLFNTSPLMVIGLFFTVGLLFIFKGNLLTRKKK